MADAIFGEVGKAKISMLHTEWNDLVKEFWKEKDKEKKDFQLEDDLFDDT